MKKSFFALSFVLICLFVIVAGCVGDSTGGFNPKGKNISELKSGGISNVPVPENYSQFMQINASTVPPYPANELVQRSDLAFYGIFKEFSSAGSGESMYSDLVFVIVDPITGILEEEVVIRMAGGVVNNYVVYVDGPLSPWDFKPGNEYLVYSSESGESYYILPGGVFNVNG